MKCLLLILLLSCSAKKEYAASIKAGEKIFQSECLRCHGEQAKGGKIANFDLTKKDSIKDKNKFLLILNEGIEGTYMRSFKSRLNKSDMDSIYMFLNNELTK